MSDTSMRQQVDVTAVLTFDADAGLSDGDLRKAVWSHLGRQVRDELDPGLVLTGFKVEHVAEEAAIYGNTDGQSEARTIALEQCCCGHKSCKTYWLKGIGSFVQGSGFTKEEANAIALRFNSYGGLLAALEGMIRLAEAAKLDDRIIVHEARAAVAQAKGGAA